MFVKLSSNVKKCKEVCQNDHNCEYAIWKPREVIWESYKWECQLYAVGTSMCSTDENKKESADHVEYEIYEGDKDFEKDSVLSDIGENTDDGSTEDPSGDQPKQIQCTPKVGSSY